jgi:hypothetical protein
MPFAEMALEGRTKCASPLPINRVSPETARDPMD